MRIDGYFNSNDEPVIKLDLISTTIEVLIDTGFAGSLIIPEQLSAGLELHFEGFDEFLTATGELLVARAYSAYVNWFGRPTRVAVAVTPDVKEPLLGSRMLRNCVVTVNYSKRSVSIVQEDDERL